MCSAHVNISSSNNEENGNNSDCSDLNPVSVECYKFLKNQTDDDFDLVYHRFQYDTSKSYSDSDDEDLQSSLDKSRSIRNKSLKNFLFLFGFASSLIILSQLYLSLYYDDPISKGMKNNVNLNFSYLFIIFSSDKMLLQPQYLDGIEIEQGKYHYMCSRISTQRWLSRWHFVKNPTRFYCWLLYVHLQTISEQGRWIWSFIIWIIIN